MNKLTVIAIYALAFVAVACGAGAGLTTTDESSFEKPGVPAETPAPSQEKGKTLIYNFDKDAAGSLPANFHDALTGKGSQGKWEVKADPTAPSAPNVLAQTSTDKTKNRFPLAIADEGSFGDLDLSVKFKPVSGKVDQAAGLVWRLKDANNYYIVRANALEGNVVMYKVADGKRSDLPVKGEGRTYGKKAIVPANQWSSLRVVMTGKLAEVYLNDVKLYEVEDTTFTDAGKIGLWTKADSITDFDDLRVTAK